MNERDIPFLNELRAELRRAAQQAPRPGRGGVLRTRRVRLLAAPALVALAAIGYVVFGLGGDSPKLPVRDYSSSAAFHPQPKVKLEGSAACVNMLGKRHLPPLVRSDATPDSALMSELSMLRQPSIPIDSTSLGNWDRYPLMISTIYQRYVRVLDGPRGVKLAFFPVAYCGQTQASTPGGSPLRRVVHTQLDESLVMLVLSNRGDHPPVLVGDAEQIKRGPALAGLGLSNSAGEQTGWVQAIVVPDGVTRVVMKFTPPFLHHYSNSVPIRSNVGIVVRRPPYTPTTVVWYGADGHVIKRFVFRKQIAQDNCLRAHRKNCLGPTPSLKHFYAIPLTTPADPQAKALYEPIIAYARATTARQRVGAHNAAGRLTAATNRCDNRYAKQLFLGLNLASKSKAMEQRVSLYNLWNHVTAMQTYEADVAPLASQLQRLASAWAGLSLSSRPMNEFAHAMATELTASIDAPPISTCAFVKAVAAHHFSYAWARSSTYGRQATRWWRRISAAGDRTAAFWKFVNPPGIGNSNGGAGQNLFTGGERTALANLPGELG